MHHQASEAKIILSYVTGVSAQSKLGFHLTAEHMQHHNRKLFITSILILFHQRFQFDDKTNKIQMV